MGRVRRAGASVLLATAMVASVVGGGVVGPADAAITPGTGGAGALAISQALATASAGVGTASFASTTEAGTPNGVSDSPLAGFPTDGSTFGILTSGNVSNVPNVGTFTSVNNGGAAVRGDTDRDVSVLKTDFVAPPGSNCLTFDFKFFSEEFPNFVGQSVNDAFVAELDTSDWTTASNVITAPNNFAFDGSGEVVSINSTGIGGMSAAEGAGTAFDGGANHGGATQTLNASRQVTPGAHSLYFSLFDQGDQVYDSAVFLDNLVVGFVPNPEVNCTGGATPVTATLDLTPLSATNPVGTEHTVTATLLNGEGAPISGASVGFTVAGVNPGTGSGTTNGSGQTDFAYTGTNVGLDQISACYNADSEGPCEADASATKEWTGVEPVTSTLNVNVTGTGSVASDPGGISCPSTCAAEFTDGSSVDLTPTAGEGSQFTGWGGACEGSGACSVTMTGDQTVSATFEVIPPAGNLGVTEVSEPATVTAGNQVQQTFTVTNGDESTQTGVTFTATFPAGSTVVSSDPSQGTCTAGPASLTCSLGTIAPGGSVTIPVIVTVPAGFPPGTFAPTATVASDQSGTGEFGDLPGSTVIAPGGGQAGGFVPPGGTITTGPASPENPTGASFTLPNSGSGVPIALIAEPTTPTYCGGQPCRGNLMFLSPFEGGYDDPNNAPKLDLSIDASVVAAFGPSYAVWVQKEDPNVAPKLVPDCKKVTTWEKHKVKIKILYPEKVWVPGSKWHKGHWKIEWKWKWVSIWKWEKTVKTIAVPSPCVAKRYIDAQGDAHTEILVLSGDPKFGRR